MPAEPAARTRLTSWKEVAGFFGKTERTVMRWEAERGMPVHRLPGETRSGVYADIAELEAWLRGSGTIAVSEPTAAGAEASLQNIATTGAAPAWLRLRFRAFAVGLALIFSVILAIAVAPALPRAPAPLSPAAKALYLLGLQDWAERNPAKLNQAVEEFSAAIKIDADYAEAYVGLADSYILLREFAVMPSNQAYALAKAAAARAIALEPGLAGAHAAYGVALLYGEWRFTEGLAEFEQALRLEPDNPGLQHWYATALMAVGQHGAALTHIERALELNPGAREVQADRALILFCQGRIGEARALLSELILKNPEFISPHVYLGALALATGDDGTYLREEAVRARLQHDELGTATADAVQAGYKSGGHAGMLRALIAARLAALASGTGSASSVARAYAAAGDKQQTLSYLSRGIERRDENAFANVNDIVYRNLLGDVALAPLRLRLGLPN